MKRWGIHHQENSRLVTPEKVWVRKFEESCATLETALRAPGAFVEGAWKCPSKYRGSVVLEPFKPLSTMAGLGNVMVSVWKGF